LLEYFANKKGTQVHSKLFVLFSANYFLVNLLSTSHRIARWEKKYGFIGFPKELEREIFEFFPEDEFTLIAFGERLGNRKFDRKWRRLFVGKSLKDNPKVVEGSIVVIDKVSEREFRLDLAKEQPPDIQPIPASLHEKIIQRWCEEQKAKFGSFMPKIMRNVNLNEILPEAIRLKENIKTVDGFAVLEVGELPIYTSILEVQHRGVREDTVVRLSLILPFVNHVDVVADIDDLSKMKELLERLVNPNIVKARVSFYTFTEYLKLK
jgi:hypothetical protein